MENSRLRKLAEKRFNKENNKENIMDIQKDKLVSFEFEGETFYLALRENVLVFDSDMTLKHTIDYDMLGLSTLPLFQKISDEVSAVRLKEESELVKVHIKRNGVNEAISFTRKFDATFIFRKLRRVATRQAENIDEITMERNNRVLDRFAPSDSKILFSRGIFARKMNKSALDDVESDRIVKALVAVEDAIEPIICARINDSQADVDISEIDKCIDLLNSLK